MHPVWQAHVGTTTVHPPRPHRRQDRLPGPGARPLQHVRLCDERESGAQDGDGGAESKAVARMVTGHTPSPWSGPSGECRARWLALREG